MQLKCVLCPIIALVAGATYSGGSSIHTIRDPASQCSGPCPANPPSASYLAMVQRQALSLNMTHRPPWEDVDVEEQAMAEGEEAQEEKVVPTCQKKVDSKKRCKEFAVSNGLKWDGKRHWLDRLPGCLKSIVDNNINWNNAENGKGQNPEQKHVCDETAASPTPASPTPASPTAGPPSPTPAPTNPTPAPTKTFDTVLGRKQSEMIWAKYGKDQPTGQTLFGYGTGREIKLKRFVNMANVKGSLCDGDQSRPDCRYKDKDMLYRIAKLEADKNRNIKAFCVNEDDVTYYLMSSVQSWVSIASRCPTEDEVLMTPNDKDNAGEGVSDETDSMRWQRFLAPSEQCPGNKGCQWKKGDAPECQKAQATKGEWTCYKQYSQTDPDLCNKGGVCAGYRS